MEQIGSQRTDFYKTLYPNILGKSVEKFKILLKSGKNEGYFGKDEGYFGKNKGYFGKNKGYFGKNEGVLWQ
jgi:hypothetical protein